MRDFVIVTDSCCDLPKEYIYGNNIPFAMLPFSYNDKEYLDDLGQSLSQKQFFDDLRDGALPNTSQANSESFYNIFKPAAKRGQDIIYVGVSSGLSGTYNSANIGKIAILEEFPSAIIYIIDVLTASLGQGLMVRKAVEMKNADCYEEAVRLKEEILAKVSVKEVLIHYIGPVVGRFSGPGALAVFFIGESRQHHVIDI